MLLLYTLGTCIPALNIFQVLFHKINELILKSACILDTVFAMIVTMEIYFD